jgi:DEAD/DEAH box helicase domain-containing protein
VINNKVSQSPETALNELRMNSEFMRQVVAWERIPARKASFVDFPPGLDARIRQALGARGIEGLYSHQLAAIDAVALNHNVVVSTSTASGKSLCYTIPVLSRLLANPAARALYLFPTKALAHDQLAELTATISVGELPLEVASYDGDTTQSHRRQARQSRGVLVTNPDMIHAGILPQHTGWRDLFSNLHFIVVDEIHAYRGVFGSHVANVIRRLKRICRFYGSDPQFICCSATIANPREHAERLIELPFKSIEEPSNGAPTGEKQFILYNPPMIDEELGMRRSSILEAKDVANTFLNHRVQTVIFARARQTVELLLAYLQDDAPRYSREAQEISGYRGGYLPLERREIERGLRGGELRGVVATNALELGVDIGQLSAAVLTGYPGSIASTWQQAGRAGRRSGLSAVVMVASGNALDQYLCQHPKYLFGRTPENALCNPDNLRIMVKHLGCAAYELPLKSGERYGSYGTVDELLDTLEEAGLIYRANEQYHWTGEGIPAHQVSLRTSGDDTVVIQDISSDRPQTIGEVDLESVPLLVYEGAIYMHQARTFLVESLDWEGRLANVRAAEVDYYTRSSMGSTIRKLVSEEEKEAGEVTCAHGDLLLVTKASGYRKIKRYTHETLGFGEIDLPEIELDTSGYWIIFGERLTDKLVDEGLLARPNEYGPNWRQQRDRALERDGYRCRTCGSEAREGQGLHVHHIRPFRDYGYSPGKNEAYRLANELENLVTLCPTCHRQAEAGQQTRSALGGLAYALNNLAPLFLMCDPGDIHYTADIRNPITKAPTVVIYERVAAGVGFSQKLYEIHDELLQEAQRMISGCRCTEGCPACVGPPGAIGPDTKESTKRLLAILRSN